ncbi:MAG: hypothetical protein E7Z89_04240 [Cyanobacteria bacterium SIG28]|nr:hypothetical protein [Cyanobacteria bacterium SIG28]
MRIPSIQQISYRQIYKNKDYATSPVCTTDLERKTNEPANFYYPPNITFGIANSAKLKTLFCYGLPSIYGEKYMIDPKKVQRMLKAKAFDLPIAEVMERLKIFEECLDETELKVYNILKYESKRNPAYTVQQTLQSISPLYEKKLQRTQKPILANLEEKAKELPDDYYYKFKLFMQENYNKLEKRPIDAPFSTKEFQYKLEKIRSDVNGMNNVKATRAMNKLIEEAKKLDEKTNDDNIEHQKDVIKFLEIVLKSSTLKKNEQLKSLLKASKQRLNNEKIVLPFTRKSFIYDLHQLLDGMPNEDLKTEMDEIAGTLPTSRENTAAYIVKFARESSEKIVYRVLWPFLASVEHLLPRAKGGADAMHNFAGATTRQNSDRGSVDFTEQMKRIPNIEKYCQNYLDRLIQLKSRGVFIKEKIDTQYIYDFKDTIEKLSEGKIQLKIEGMS